MKREYHQECNGWTVYRREYVSGEILWEAVKKEKGKTIRKFSGYPLQLARRIEEHESHEDGEKVLAMVRCEHLIEQYISAEFIRSNDEDWVMVKINGKKDEVLLRNVCRDTPEIEK